MMSCPDYGASPRASFTFIFAFESGDMLTKDPKVGGSNPLKHAFHHPHEPFSLLGSL
jgi:hypothetical protein